MAIGRRRDHPALGHRLGDVPGTAHSASERHPDPPIPPAGDTAGRRRAGQRDRALGPGVARPCRRAVDRRDRSAGAVARHQGRHLLAGRPDAGRVRPRNELARLGDRRSRGAAQLSGFDSQPGSLTFRADGLLAVGSNRGAIWFWQTGHSANTLQQARGNIRAGGAAVTPATNTTTTAPNAAAGAKADIARLRRSRAPAAA